MKAYDFSRLNVLVVDDSSHMRQLVRTILYAFGCLNVYDASDGTQAIAMLQKHQVDILIIDWMMEPMDGIDLTRTIRNDEIVPNPYVPIIMLTAHTTIQNILHAREAGVTEYLAKPLTPRGLLSRLHMVIGNPRPFVRTAHFFGPDRRRKDSSFYTGPERREDADKAADIFELDDMEDDAA
ncbi:MAG: response regulator [Candidatus Phaeomarinobacter sp.]